MNTEVPVFKPGQQTSSKQASQVPSKAASPKNATQLSTAVGFSGAADAAAAPQQPEAPQLTETGKQLNLAASAFVPTKKKQAPVAVVVQQQPPAPKVLDPTSQKIMANS